MHFGHRGIVMFPNPDPDENRDENPNGDPPENPVRNHLRDPTGIRIRDNVELQFFGFYGFSMGGGSSEEEDDLDDVDLDDESSEEEKVSFLFLFPKSRLSHLKKITFLTW